VPGDRELNSRLPRRSIAPCLALILVGPILHAEPHDFCDPGLRQVSGADGYQMRGDRCEGLYAQPLSATTDLQVVGLYRMDERIALESNRAVQLAWHAGDSHSPIHLRIYSLNPRVYYRMDALRPAGTQSYSWSPDVARSVGLSLQELGFISWIEGADAQSQPVYLPLTVGNGDPSAQSVRVLAISQQRLTEVYVTVASLLSDGQPNQYIDKERPLQRGFYPPERPITVVLSELSGEGLYVMELGATFGSNDSAATSVLFYSAGRSHDR
jgi:hypothetical protein